MKIEVDIDYAKTIYTEGDEHIKEALKKVFGDKFFDNKIKSIDDAINVIGCGHPLVYVMNMLLDNGSELFSSTINELRLEIICMALNKENSFSDGISEYWYPIFEIRECKKFHFLSDVWKDIYRPVHIKDKEYFVYTGCKSIKSYGYFANNTRMAFKDKETAEYAGKEFIKYYKEYYIGR